MALKTGQGGSELPEYSKENVFLENHVFNSSSEAAAVILGYAVSGPQTWHYEDGTTLKQANEKAAGEAE